MKTKDSTSAKEEQEFISVPVPPGFKGKVRQLAARKNLTMAAYIRELLEAEINKSNGYLAKL